MKVIPLALPATCYKEEMRTLETDTIVIHHISAVRWDDRKLENHSDESIDGLRLPSLAAGERKFHPLYCIAQLIMDKLSYHYIIDRIGNIYKLVEEDRVAWHAGISKMPNDGREWVNGFSIGISLIATHPDDDPDVSSHRIPAYTKEQYSSLFDLTGELCMKYPIRYIVGHDEIAPDRKKDPGPLFDWRQIRNSNLSPISKTIK